MRAADALIAALLQEGCEVAFGLPGGASLPLHDALHGSALRHVLVRHEAAAGHAAEGYARATGRVGVCFATSGPGATNLVTPLADAMMDSTPIVAITGQVRTDLRGTDAFQETDVIGVTAPIVKHAIAVERARDVVPAIREAFAVASGGRPGPVLVDVPSDVAREIVPRDALSGGGAATLPAGFDATPPVADRAAVRAAAAALAGARRPVLYVGGGVVHAGAGAELRALADAGGGLPVTTTLMALGAFPASDPRWLGMLGMHGCRTANWAVDECDVLVAIGARFDDRVTGRLDQFAPAAKQVIHLDIDRAEIGKLRTPDVALHGDARATLAALAAAVRELRPDAERLGEWWRVLDAWRSAEADPEAPDDGAIHPAHALDALRRATAGRETIVTTDVGNHQMWAAKRLRFDAPRRWLTSGGLGTMGFGLPAALGAQVARPDATVVCVSGDGSLLMNMQELVTARAEALPVKVLLINDGALGMVRQQQDLFWDGRRQDVDLGPAPDWALLARACGWSNAERVEQADDVDDAVARLIDADGPALLDVAVAPDADCLPMFAPGAAARDMIG
ncbi:biosynthetic-type acetolactate synthase large subunit [Conexibacter woesei]|uniref:biosynthetic-type acetolactate synthase large subunit n=1 Tax=Conexibacter woesei TaxID=191495 RepID=UPI0003F794FB|nr:biosynthetic-type acetolactate synthase large subunit [Conexibacter woesei]